MKNFMCAMVAAAALLMGTTFPSEAADRHQGGHHFGGGHHFRPHLNQVRTRVFVGVGPVWWGPGWWGPPPYAYPYPVYTPPVVVQQEPPVYIQQPTPQYWQQPTAQYWYYCENPRGYYPHVQQCPQGWMTVLPSAPAQ